MWQVEPTRGTLKAHMSWTGLSLGISSKKWPLDVACLGRRRAEAAGEVKLPGGLIFSMENP